MSIPQNEIKKIVSNTDSNFAITSPITSITFDSKALETISEANSSGTVVISAGIIDSNALSDADKEKVGGRPVYDFTVMNGTEQVSMFGGGHATISVPYQLQPGENPNSVVVFYLKDDGSLETVRGHYNASSGAVVFKTAHFSHFAIGYNPIPFVDLASNAWYKDAVDFIAARGISTGTGNHKFSPADKLTRGQFVVLLMNSYQISPVLSQTDNAVNFSDAGNTYYTDYLAAAKSLGIASGIGNDRFAPNQEITRQEMLVMLYNALNAIDEVPASTVDKELSGLNDAGQVASWANEALSALLKAGVVSGNNNNINPTSYTTRAEIAQVFYNLLSE